LGLGPFEIDVVIEGLRLAVRRTSDEQPVLMAGTRTTRCRVSRLLSG
jgi:hypothetical protein